MNCYLDNAATTWVYPEVADAVCQLMKTEYGNPSSLHSAGLRAEHIVTEARERIAATMKVLPKELIFTSGGTESNNMAILGAAQARRRAGTHIITSWIEHPSVLNVMHQLEKQGFEVTYLPVDERGVVEIEAFDAALDEHPDTILVSVMLVNNEVGSVQPIAKLAELLKKKGSDAYLHVDAVQAYGKIPVKPKQLGADLLSVSGHKLHGPKGVGFLYVRDGVRILPILYGGGQQKNMRSGTEDVFGIFGLGAAAKKAVDNVEDNLAKILLLTTKLENGLRALPDVVIHTKDYAQFPYILSTSFCGVRSEVLLHTLDERGICVSSGSACATNDKHTSETLKAMKLKEDMIDSAIRFSFSTQNTEEEITYVLEVLGECLPKLRKYQRS